MDFFVMPNELASWIGNYLTDPNTWTVVWDVHRCAYSAISSSGGATVLSGYGDGQISNGVQFFFGHKGLTSGPVMRTGGDSLQRIDFRSSLCIQVAPCFIARDALLKGSFGTLDPKEYRKIPAERQFMLWRRDAYRSFKKAFSESSVMATQLLSDGTLKEWREIIISTGAVKWSRDGGKLKEFSEGPVEFLPESSGEQAAADSQPRSAR
jgi:hypothetical protein